jgi:hypothetical protein
MNSPSGQKEKKSNAQRQKRKIFSAKNNLRTCNFWDDNFVYERPEGLIFTRGFDIIRNEAR